MESDVTFGQNRDHFFFIHIVTPTILSQLLLHIMKTKADKDVFMRDEMGGNTDGKTMGKQNSKIFLSIYKNSVSTIFFLV